MKSKISEASKSRLGLRSVRHRRACLLNLICYKSKPQFCWTDISPIGMHLNSLEFEPTTDWQCQDLIIHKCFQLRTCARCCSSVHDL